MALSADDNEDIVTINVGGMLFQTRRSVLTSDPECKLSNPDFLREHHHQNPDQFFFDRNPQIFGAVLNYLRTKELHLPSNVCSAVAGLELEFWGIQTHSIERCCWTRYNQWRSNLAAMVRLERNRNVQEGDGKGKGDNSFWTRYRATIWRLFSGTPTSPPAKIFEVVSFILAIMSLFAFIFATIEPFKKTRGQTGSSNGTEQLEFETATLSLMSKDMFLNIIDLVCLVYFTLEYLVRLVFSPVKRKYLFSFLAIIELVALLPDYIDGVLLLVGSHLQVNLADIRYAGIVRVLRTLRIFRLVRHNVGLWVLLYTLKASARELLLLIWFLLVGTTLFASLIYLAEEREVFGSIPESYWWALITMTTVGYGDVYPVTPWGKVVGSFCAMSGLLLIGFTVPILVNNFVMFYSQVKAVKDFEKRSKAHYTVPLMTHL